MLTQGPLAPSMSLVMITPTGANMKTSPVHRNFSFHTLHGESRSEIAIRTAVIDVTLA